MSSNEYNRAYYQANRERLIAAQKAYYQQNRERIRAQRNAYAEANRDAINARARERYRANPEPAKAAAKRWWDKTQPRLKQHGLTPDQYDRMLALQSGLCAICEQPFSGIPYIDHDHTTGAVRGLLCHNCNVALGHFRDNPEYMRRAIKYLDTTPLALMEDPQ